MNYKAIIKDAWITTQTNKRLIWWLAFVPALLSTVVGIIYLAYQAVSFYNAPFLHNGSTSSGKSAFEIIIDFTKDVFHYSTGFGVLLIVLSAITVIFYFLLPAFTQGGLIKTLAKNRTDGSPILIKEAIGSGFSKFLQLLEYQTIIRTFSFVGVFTEMSFVIRNLGVDAFELFLGIFIIILIVSVFLSSLFAYSEYYITLDDKGVFDSMIASASLVLKQWHHTLFMFLMMLSIAIRIFLNLLFALLVPAVIIAPAFLFANFSFAGFSVAVGIIAGSIALYFASYFLGVFHVFTSAVWTYTYIELKNEEGA